MQRASIPYKFGKTWGALAAGAYLTSPVPAVSVGPRSGQDLGFPPVTGTPVVSGGIPPDIRDINGVLAYVTAWLAYLQAGTTTAFDVAFASGQGGYPLGAEIPQGGDPVSRWTSAADGNAINPDTAPGTAWFNSSRGKLLTAPLLFSFSTILTLAGTGTGSNNLPVGMRHAIVMLLGGGGAGGKAAATGTGSAQFSIGSGGTSGARVLAFMDATGANSILGANLVIGSGGFGLNAGAGTDTSLTVSGQGTPFLLAKGGPAGNGVLQPVSFAPLIVTASYSGGGSILGSNGVFEANSGVLGGDGIILPSANFTGGIYGKGGIGGSVNLYGNPGQGGTTGINNGTGGDAGGYGAGGGGAVNGPNGVDAFGGSGAPGLCLVFPFT